MKLFFKYALFICAILLFVLGIVSMTYVTEFIEVCSEQSSIFRVDIVIYIFISLSLLIILVISIFSLLKGLKKIMDYFYIINVSIFILFILIYAIIWFEIYSVSNVVIDTNEMLVLTNSLSILEHCIIAQGIVIIVSIMEYYSKGDKITNIVYDEIEDNCLTSEEEKTLNQEINKLKAKLKVKELEEEYLFLRTKLEEKKKK